MLKLKFWWHHINELRFCDILSIRTIWNVWYRSISWWNHIRGVESAGILWLTRECQIAWKFGKTSRDWRTGVIIPIVKQEDRRQCTNYREISLFRLPGKVYAKCRKTKCRIIVELTLEVSQCGFCLCRSNTNQGPYYSLRENMNIRVSEVIRFSNFYSE